MASISLRSDDHHLFELSLSRTRLATGALILDKGIDHILFIEKGIVSPMLISTDGNSLGIAIIGNEGAVGLRGIGAGAYSLQARALTEVEAMQLSTRGAGLGMLEEQGVGEPAATLLRFIHSGFDSYDGMSLPS